jgi:D-glycero-alpha-D-manno-heptose-7-phosphate kinase
MFLPDGTYEVRPVILSRERREALQDHLILVFTGIARNAADAAQAQIDNLKHRAAELTRLQEMVAEGLAIVSTPSQDLASFGRLLGEAWTLKRRLADRVSNRTIDDLYAAAVRACAVGGKLLGAGGGGFLLLFVKPADREKVRAALPGLVTLPVRFEAAGSRVVLYQPDGL